MTTLDCGHDYTPPAAGESGGTGYASLRVHTGAERRICYACCAECDKYRMNRGETLTLYLSNGEVTNWPGSLRFKAFNITRSRMNGFGGYYPRTTARFRGPDGCLWTIDVRGDMECGRAYRLKDPR